MSDAGDDIPVDAPAEVETTEAPKGKLSIEDALQVRHHHDLETLLSLTNQCSKF